MSLETYKKKRNFDKTSEPQPRAAKSHRRPIFVVQEHHASRLHYDFRLEADGVLKSWAVPRQPSLDPADKRLAVRVEDHPLDYANFSGEIPEGEYGAGLVKIWDRGTYENLLAGKPRSQTITEGIRTGHLEVELRGRRLKGGFALVRMKGRGKKDNWLLVKMKDQEARPRLVSGKEKKAAKTSRSTGARSTTKRSSRSRKATSSTAAGSRRGAG